MTGGASQYQEALPEVRPLVRRFDIEVGHCSQCQQRVQGRHALQTSDALGAAAAQLGPNVAALVVELHTELGMPLEKVTRVLRTQFGLSVTKGGLVQLLHRSAAAAAPAYAALPPSPGLACRNTTSGYTSGVPNTDLKASNFSSACARSSIDRLCLTMLYIQTAAAGLMSPGSSFHLTATPTTTQA